MHYLKKLPLIKHILLDVDGVLTDGAITLMPDGGVLRTLNSKDGYAIQLAVKKGLDVFIVTGARDEYLKERLERMGVKEVKLGSSDKIEALEELELAYDLDLNLSLYMGDDIPDYDVMERVGIAACPEDAVSEIRSICSYISPFKGGAGCVRDIIEKVLKSQESWFNSKSDLQW